MNLHKFVSLCFSKYTQVGAKKYVDSYFNSCAPEGLSEKESRCIGHFLTLFKAIKLYTQFIPWVVTKQGIQAAINATNPSAHPSSNPLIELTNSVMNSLDGFKGSPGYTDFQKKLSAFLDHFIERPNDTKEPSLEERGLSNAVVPFLALLELIRPHKNELSIRETYYTLTSEIVALITDKHYQPLDHKNDGQNIANSDCLIEHLTMFKALQDCPLKDSCQRIIDGVLNTQAKLLQPHRIRDQFPVLKDQHYLKSVMQGKPNEVPEFLRSPLYPILKEKTAKQQGLDYLRNNMLIGPPFQASVNESEDFGPESAINLFQKYAKPKKLGPGVNIEFFSSILIWDILSKIDCPTPPQLNTIISFSFRSLSEKGCCFFDEKRFPNDSDVTGIFLSTYLKQYKLVPDALLKLAHLFTSATNDDGHIKVYFEPNGHFEGSDHVVSCNALSAVLELLKQDCINEDDTVVDTLNRIKKKALEQIKTTLFTEEQFYNGSVYYPSPDVFLYFVSRLFLLLDQEEKADLKPILDRRIKQRTLNCLNPSRTHLEQACLIIAQQYLGLPTPCELASALYREKNSEGFWAKAPFYKTRTQSLFFGSVYLSTAFAVHAADLYEQYVNKNKESYDIPHILYPWDHYSLTKESILHVKAKLNSYYSSLPKENATTLNKYKDTILTFTQFCSSTMEEKAEDTTQDVFLVKIKFLVFVFSINDLTKDKNNEVIQALEKPNQDEDPLITNVRLLYTNFLDSFEEPQKSKIKTILTEFLEASKRESSPKSLDMDLEAYDAMRIQLICMRLWLKITFYGLNLDSVALLEDKESSNALEDLEILAARCVYIDNDDVSILRSLDEERPTTVSVFYRQLTQRILSFKDIETKEYEQALRRSRAYHVQSREAFLETFDRLFLKFERDIPLRGYLEHIKNTVIGNSMVQIQNSRYIQPPISR